MAKSSAKRTLSGLHQLFCKTPSQFQHSKSVPSSSFEFSSFRHLTSSISSSPSSPSKILRGACPIGFLSRPSSANGTVSRLLSRNYNLGAPFSNNPIKAPSYGISSSGFSNSTRSSPKIPIGLPPLPSRVSVNGSRYRFFSTKISNLGKTGSIVPKPLLRNPVSAVSSAVSRYRQAVGLQTEAFWKRNYLILVGAGAVVLCVLLWRIMFGVASTFVGLSEGMAKYGFLALAAAMVSFAGMYIRARLTINPDKVYRMAMRKLNTSAGILEAMGAPLTGTELRAYVMSGGGPRLKDFKVRYGSNRCFLIFPIRGSERKGLVSVEAKKKKGQYDMKLLAVDIPMATGPDQRLFLIGDEEEYRVGGGLISELRDPIVKAMAAEKEFEDLDEKEEEEDEARELEEAERKQLEDEESAREEERKRRELQSLERESS